MLTGTTKPNAFKPRWSKVLSDLRGSRSRTLMVVASIAVGVFAIGMIVSAYVIISEEINTSYASVHPVNIETWTDPFHAEFVHIIERVPGVTDAEGRRFISIRARKYDEVWQGLNLIAAPDFDNININQLTAIEGTSIPGRREIIVSDSFMSSTGYQVGDEILIELPDGSSHTLPLVGMVNDQATGRGDPSSPPMLLRASSTLFSMRVSWALFNSNSCRYWSGMSAESSSA